MDALNAVLSFLGSIFPLVVALAVVVGVIRYAPQVFSQLFGTSLPISLASVAVVAILALTAIGIWRPTTFATLTDFSLGIDREQKRLDTELYSFIIDPSERPYVWDNPVSQTAAIAIQQGYATAIQRQLTEQTRSQAEQMAASAETDCHRNPTDPLRLRWGNIDPCQVSTPAGLQAMRHSVQQVDWQRTNEWMRKPLPVTSSLTTSTGVAIWVGGLVSLLVAGLVVRFAFR